MSVYGCSRCGDEDCYPECSGTNKILRAENERLKKSLAKAKEALEFYWPIVGAVGCQHDDPSWCTKECGDYGKRCRKALAEIEKVK